MVGRLTDPHHAKRLQRWHHCKFRQRRSCRRPSCVFPQMADERLHHRDHRVAADLVDERLDAQVVAAVPLSMCSAVRVSSPRQYGQPDTVLRQMGARLDGVRVQPI